MTPPLPPSRTPRIVGLAIALSLLGSLAFFVANSPDNLMEIFEQAGELLAPVQNTWINDYLVMLTEDTPENRRALQAVSPHLGFVGESVLPEVVVVNIQENQQEVLTKIRNLKFVDMVIRYNPSFGCH